MRSMPQVKGNDNAKWKIMTIKQKYKYLFYYMLCFITIVEIRKNIIQLSKRVIKTMFCSKSFIQSVLRLSNFYPIALTAELVEVSVFSECFLFFFFFFFFTPPGSMKLWRGYIFTSVCLCVCLSVCPSVNSDAISPTDFILGAKVQFSKAHSMTQ